MAEEAEKTISAEKHGNVVIDNPDGVLHLLIEQGRHEEQVLSQMKIAVDQGDKEEVFRLAKELLSYD